MSLLSLHPFVTAMVSIGNFPKPPKIISQFTQYPLFQWFMLMLLVYQSGGRQNIYITVITVLIVFIVYNILYLFDDAFNAKQDKK